MLQAGDVIEVPALGFVVEIRENDPDCFAADIVGLPKGFLTQPHVHEKALERFEVVEGGMVLTLDGRRHELRAGDAIEVPPGTVHRQEALDGMSGRLRVSHRPAGEIGTFLVRLGEMSRAGGFTRRGYPKPVAAARLLRDTGDEGHAAFPPLRVQRALASAILAVADPEYRFADEWDVAAPREVVFAALADAESYPRWWRPVYLDVDATPGPPAVGKVSRQHFKGRLPYHLHTESTITELDPPSVIAADVTGDLRGRGRWTVTAAPAGTHVRFEWEVFADRPLLRALTPLLRPALRANHAWAITRAREGLEPYARLHALEHQPEVVEQLALEADPVRADS